MGLGEERHPAGAQQAQAKGNSYREAHICSHRNNPWFPQFSSVQLSSVAQSCPTLCDPMDCSMPGFLVHYQLPELTQIHVHRVSDAIQLSHPVVSVSSHLQSFPASGSFSMCQFFASDIGVSASASVLPMLDLLAVQGLSRVFSNTTVQKHQFFCTQLFL